MKIKTYFRRTKSKIINLNTEISEGVKVTVTSNFRTDLSHLDLGRYFFNYRIEIKNFNHFKIKLLHRDWYIFDSLGEAVFVSGEGVVGEQPVLQGGESFRYTSGVELASELGYMKGYFTFINLGTENHFQVHVPKIQLNCPLKLN
ncbi:Co2+/Mg2+ efflux protein ApaG [Crocinitomicaceae bacterium]|nr:Co2+/Mg2+ efflux protein ApaG [Crocinitomicaceae bacterium]